MTFPAGPLGPGRERKPVRAIRDRRGRWLFQDPRTGRFISREAGINRLRFNPDTNQLVDDFGNAVGPGALTMRKRGLRRDFRNGFMVWNKLDVPLAEHQIRPNQRYVERLTIRTTTGEIEQVFITHGKGDRLRIEPGSKPAKSWGGKLREAAGLDRGVKVSTRRLREFVLHREVVVVETTYR